MFLLDIRGLSALRVAKLERQAFQLTIRESVELNIAESKAARSTSNFSKYAEAEKSIASKISSVDETTNPVLELSRTEFPNHTNMLDNALAKGHSLEDLTRGAGTKAADKNRYNSQKEIRKKTGRTKKWL